MLCINNSFVLPFQKLHQLVAGPSYSSLIFFVISFTCTADLKPHLLRRLPSLYFSHHLNLFLGFSLLYFFNFHSCIIPLYISSFCLRPPHLSHLLLLLPLSFPFQFPLCIINGCLLLPFFRGFVGFSSWGLRRPAYTLYMYVCMYVCMFIRPTLVSFQSFNLSPF